MRCLSCHKLSLKVICEKCREQLLVPTVTKRKVGTLEVVSLFKYNTIEPLLLTKHTPAGFRIYRYLSRQFLKPFLAEFAMHLDKPVTLLAVDEQTKGGYSHTALMSRFAANSKIRPEYTKLLAKNMVSYAGKSLQYRLSHPRDFHYTGDTGLEAILLDDIITTGVTFQQAQRELSQNGVNVLFALTLADARD